MARVELLDDRFAIRNEGLRRLLTIAGTITVRYEAVGSVEVGLDEVPPWFTWRIGYDHDPKRTLVLQGGPVRHLKRT